MKKGVAESRAAKKTVNVRRRRRGSARARPSIVGALPDDLIVDIVGRLAARSPEPTDDLHSVRATCKAMYAASRERYVGRRVSLEKEKAMKWRDNGRYLTVLENLAGAGNPEACFLVGLTLVFAHHGKQHQGLAFLEQAAAAGHRTAAYVLGVLLYTADDDMRAAAKQYISQVEGDDAGKRTNRECKRCRRLAAEAILEVTWKRMAGPPGRVPVMPEDGHLCTSKGCGLPEGWAEYNVFCSDGCRIRHESTKFFTQVYTYLP